MFKLIVLAVAVCSLTACRGADPTPPPAPEEEMLSRTEFTERIENFFEYAPLKPGRPSAFLIHLTDLSDGSPVEQAQVTLFARRDGSAAVTQTTARVGRVTGIYVAELTVPEAGAYELEFHIKNSKLDERLVLSGFGE